MTWWTRALAASVIAVVPAIAAPLRADEESGPPRSDEAPARTGTAQSGSHWQPQWPRFHLAEGFVTLVAEATAIAIYAEEPRREVGWRDRLPLDPEFRDALRLDSYEGQSVVNDASTILFAAIAIWPALVDALLLAGLVRGDGDVALQMLLIDAEAMAIAHVVTWLTTRLVGRVRPRHLECTLADTCADRGVGPVASFVSGHALFAYAGAGLICTHNLVHPWVWGSIEGASIACASGLALSTLTGVMRIMSDLHWASDVAISAVIGSTIGFGVPLLLHYARPRSARLQGARSQGARSQGAPQFLVTPGVAGEPGGLSIAGVF